MPSLSEAAGYTGECVKGCQCLSGGGTAWHLVFTPAGAETQLSVHAEQIWQNSHEKAP